MLSTTRKLLLLTILALLLSGALSACSASNSDHAQLTLMPLEQMPDAVQSAPAAVQQAYQFAAGNPQVLKEIPCYCGCGSLGHTSNYDCYISAAGAQGSLAFDNHALGCSICVDITQDVMRRLQEGGSTQDARDYVDATYGRYGPSNIP